MEQQISSETQVALTASVAVDDRRPAQRPALTGRGREQISNDEAVARSSQNTQCFICSRIYFDQDLQKCPNCNSSSLQHYTNDDLIHFARGTVGARVGLPAWFQEGKQVPR